MSNKHSRHQKNLGKVWRQGKVPVVLRRNGRGEKIRLRLPGSKEKLDWDDFDWLKNGKRTRPIWNYDEHFWEIPKSWFNDFVERSLRRYRQLFVIQPYREQEICAAACMNATGHECQCSCMGANHGMGNDGSWFEISETFATKWRDRELAVRLMKLR